MTVDLEQIIKQISDSEIVPPRRLEDFVPPKSQPDSVENLVRELVKEKLLTRFQAAQILAGKPQILVLGGYVLMDKIGAGGMGQVYKAQHRRMKRVVALKTLPTKTMKDPEQVARFQREVEAAAKLRHMNIVAADDADEFNGVHFLVMEYVEGKDLSAIVKQEGPLSVAKAVDYVIQAARGLEYAHKKGIVHRDIKPANLLLSTEDVVKVLDMGLARVQGDNAFSTQAELTGTGMMMGTIDYCAPEQAQDSKKADGRADIYSLGCTLAYLLTGQPTYSGDSLIAKLLAHREATIPSLRDSRPDVPAALDNVFRKMIAKHPDDRFQTMTEVIERLEALKPKLPTTRPKSAAKGPLSQETSAFEKTVNSAAGQTGMISSVTQFLNSYQRGHRKWFVAGIFAAVIAMGGLLFKFVASRSPSAVSTQAVGNNTSQSAVAAVEKAAPKSENQSTGSDQSSALAAGPVTGATNSFGAVQIPISGQALVELLTSADLEWSAPEPLGPAVNSAEMEVCPRITAGGKRLWFLRVGIVMTSQRQSLNGPWETAAPCTPVVEMPDDIGGRSDKPFPRGDLFVSRDERRIGLITWVQGSPMPLWETAREKAADPWPPIRISMRPEGNCQFPLISDDGLRLYFTGYGSKQSPSTGDQDVFYASRSGPDQPWSIPVTLNVPLNSPLVERSTWLSSDERLMLLAVSENSQNRSVYRNCWSFRQGDDKARGWSKPVPLDIASVNNVTDAGAVLSDDGRELYFESQRPGGQGVSDIWFSRLVKRAAGSKPRKSEQQNTSIAQKIDYTLERRVAKWLQDQHTVLELSTGRCEADAPLPESDFQVLAFGFRFGSKIGGDNLVDKLNDFRKLSAFQGGYLPCQDADLWAEVFADISTVRHVNAYNTDLTDAGMKHLGRIKQIDYFNLDFNPDLDTKVTGRGLAELVRCESIRTMSINSRPFKAGQMTLADVQKIQHAHPAAKISFAGSPGDIPGLLPAAPSDRWPFDPADGKEYVWSSPENLGPIVNSNFHDFLSGVSADELSLFIRSGNMGHFVCERGKVQDKFRTRQAIASVGKEFHDSTFAGNRLAFVGAKDHETALTFADRHARDQDFIVQSNFIPETGVHPVLSEDSLTLLVTSVRSGSLAGDIWMYERKSPGDAFRPAMRLPEPVNTPYWDMPAYISNDRCFVIAMSQFDDPDKKLVRKAKWYTRRNAGADFSAGQPLDIPLGPAEDNFENAGYCLSGDGLAVYFHSSKVPGSLGFLDIYVSRRVPKK